MNGSSDGRTFAVKARLKAQKLNAEPFAAIRLPRLPASEVASIAGLEAVRRALDEFVTGSLSA
ncbi:hypothetical protein ACFPQ7_12700 [Methylobacterium iners]|uniref:Uncharacterized protein n=1 Tax=Methylobacterium iners TaxID=418707 RepID=A0ABQ4S1N8_9HYPH|nr:hypothetical protein OCOJLMKI_4138 [Methylobacterium iners]